MQICESGRTVGGTIIPKYLTVCNYGPAGNYIGKKPYIVGTPGSKCPAGKTCLTKTIS